MPSKVYLVLYDLSEINYYLHPIGIGACKNLFIK
jgi:hypothetical protein